MKHKFLTKIGLFVLLVGIVSSCNWIDPEMNINPDAPADVPMDLLLPSIEARVAFNVVGGNDMTRTVSMWVQQTTGVVRQSQVEGSYILKSDDVNNLWGDVYSDALMDAKQLIDKAAAEPASPHFAGVAKILQAVTLGYATDVWNDIPWTEALGGSANFQPAFDSQEAIYNTIQGLLDQGIVDLSVSADDNAIALSGDIIFNGDTDKWIKAAYALKARYYLHLSKRNGAAAYDNALANISKAFTSNDGNMMYYYAEASDNNANPLYLFMDQRTDIRMCSYMVDSLKNHLDPRLNVFVAPITSAIVGDDGDTLYWPGDYAGAPPGVPLEAASWPGPGIASSGAPTPIITLAELMFMKAECMAMTSNYSGARTAYKDGLQASLEQYGVFSDVWYDAYTAAIDQIPDPLMMKAIMVEKWISLCYQTESFTDWRRTGYPELSPNPSAGVQVIPRRFPYASDPIAYNTNTPALNAPLYDRLWWDTE